MVVHQDRCNHIFYRKTNINDWHWAEHFTMQVRESGIHQHQPVERRRLYLPIEGSVALEIVDIDITEPNQIYTQRLGCFHRSPPHRAAIGIGQSPGDYETKRGPCPLGVPTRFSAFRSVGGCRHFSSLQPRRDNFRALIMSREFVEDRGFRGRDYRPSPEHSGQNPASTKNTLSRPEVIILPLHAPTNSATGLSEICPLLNPSPLYENPESTKPSSSGIPRRNVIISTIN